MREKRGPDRRLANISILLSNRKLLERLERIEGLPRRKQEAILTTIDHFLNSAAG